MKLFKLMILLVLTGSAVTASYYVDVPAGYNSRDIGVGMVSIEGGFNTRDGKAHYWNAGSGYKVCDLEMGTITEMGKPATYSNFYGDPFGLYDWQNDVFYAATFLNGGNSFLYKYDYATGAWSEEGGAINMYGGDVHNGDLYISGLREPWSGGFDTTYISLYDFSGADNHDALIEVGGASAHVALDSAGNVYYGTYDFGNSALYRWTASQVSSVMDDLTGGEDDTYLTLADGEKLSDMPDGANGIVVDDAGHVFFTCNGSNSILGMWNGVGGDGDNYDILGTAPAGTFGWFGPLSIEGNFMAGDPLYGSYGFYGPITEITIPEPTTLALLGIGGMLFMRRRG